MLYYINLYGSSSCFNNSTALFHTKLPFHIISALLTYSFTKKKQLRQLRFHKKFNLRNKGECTIELCTSFSKAKVEALRTMKNGFENCSPYIATQP